MKPYADAPGRFLRQFTGDVIVMAWIAAWVWLGVTARDWITRMAAPGRAMDNAGTSFQDSLNNAGNSAGKVPLVGGSLRDALHSAGSAGGRLSAAGQAEQQTISQIALWAMIVLIVLPVVMALALYLPGRVRWMREAGAARRLLTRTEGGADVLALRALVTQPPRRIKSAAGDDPVAAWRRGDSEVVAQLAALQAKSLGVRR